MALDKVVVIAGPTASGKTELSIALAKEFGGEIVNADSRQVYQGMDIGTAKPERDPKPPHMFRDPISKHWGKYFSDGVQHHCLDLVNPDEDMTVALWKKAALQAIHEIVKRGRIPFVVGGTWLYISALIDNYDIPQVAPNQTLRRKMLELLEGEDGLEELARQLTALDPNASVRVDLRNPRRVMRALEVSLATGKPFTQQLTKGKPLFDALHIGVDRPAKALNERITKRVHMMMESGLLEEVKQLNDRYGCGLPALTGIGYTELCRVLSGDTSLKQAVEDTILHTKQFAKKQRAWFGRDSRIRWASGLAEARSLLASFLGS